MKANRNAEAEIESLKRELATVRRASLVAARRGDFMRSAKLTTQAAALSKALLQAEGLISLDLI